MLKLLTIFATLSLTACAGTPAIVTTPPARCADLVPSGWSEGVESAPVPSNADVSGWIGQPLTKAVVAAIVAPWASAYVAQDGQLQKANGRTKDAMAIQRNCEAMVNEARPDAD